MNRTVSVYEKFDELNKVLKNVSKNIYKDASEFEEPF
jgi:hypothetical protein